jgi:small subunit ribosomal protein S8
VGVEVASEVLELQDLRQLAGDSRLDLSSLVAEVVPFDRAVEVYEQINRGDLSGMGVLFRYRPDPPLARRTMNTNLRQSTAGRVGLGVIGAGNYASSMLLPHLAAADDVALIEVVTNSALSAATAAKKFGFARFSTDYSGLLASDDISAVLIATRHATHANLVCDSLRAGKATIVSPASKLRASVLDVLIREGYIRGYQQSGEIELKIELKYHEGHPVIREISRVSRPGRRVYSKVAEIPRVYNGLGISILSTPRGVMSDNEARVANVGGEVLCRVF